MFTAEFQVAFDVPGEQDTLLRDVTKLLPEVVLGNTADILTVQCYAALGCIVEPGDQGQQLHGIALQLLRQRRGDTALLNADIHDITGITGEGQITPCLRNQQHQDQQDRRNAPLQKNGQYFALASILIVSIISFVKC